MLNFMEMGSSMSLRSFARLGSAISVLNFSSIGSSFSIRSFARAGSTVSVFGKVRLHGAHSVLDLVKVGSAISIRSFARCGSLLSAYNSCMLGSSISVRSFARLGSSLSVAGYTQIGSLSKCSVLDFSKIGSSLSVRSHARLGSKLSALCHTNLGSSMSLRSFVRLGSSLSVAGKGRFGGSLSTLNFVDISSALSLRSYARLGDSISVVNFMQIGSTLSTRSFVRLGSSISVTGALNVQGYSVTDKAEFGSALSVRSFTRLGSYQSVYSSSRAGSDISVRSFALMGSTLSVCGMISLGSSFSVRSFVRLGSTLSVGNASSPTDLRVGAALLRSSVSGSVSELTFYPGGVVTTAGKAMTLTYNSSPAATTGKLHGTWTAENSVTTSDRRLKVEILPLYRKMVGTYLNSEASKTSTAESLGSGVVSSAEVVVAKARKLDELPKHDQVLHVIRELRPVAYKMKAHTESKYSQFGFIAQEIEHILPQVVHTDDRDGMKSLRYLDLIAVITLGLQSLDERVLKMDGYLRYIEEKQDINYVQLSDRLELVSKVIKRLLKKAPRVILPKPIKALNSTMDVIFEDGVTTNDGAPTNNVQNTTSEVVNGHGVLQEQDLTKEFGRNNNNEKTIETGMATIEDVQFV